MINRRVIGSCAAFLLGGLIGCVGIPLDSSDSGGYGGYGTYPETRREYDYDDDRVWQREHRRYSCNEIEERIRYDRAKLAAIDPSKHHKATEWYRDDIRDAERDSRECRNDRRDADRERRDRDRDRDRRVDSRADCAKLRSRIATDRAKIAEINPSKHHKAAKWYQDDLRAAERELAACR